MKQNEAKSFKEKLKSKKAIVIYSMIGFTILCGLATFFFKKLYPDITLPETLYYATQIVSCFIVIGGLLVSVWQYYQSCQQKKSDLKLVQVQKAIDLSAYYKDHIISLSQPIGYVFKNSGRTVFLDAIDINKIENFDCAEMNELLTPEVLEKYRNSITTKEFITAVFEANYAYSLNIPLNHAISKNKENDCISINNQKVAEAFMSKIVLELLNNMEYFAMHFTHGVADDSVVFQSLHQTYIHICQTLYCTISNYNKMGESKYYTNLISLYNKWKQEVDKQNQKLIASSRTNISPGTIIE